MQRMDPSGLDGGYEASVQYVPDIQSTLTAFTYRGNIVPQERDQGNDLASSLKYHVLGMSQLVLRLCTLLIVLLIVMVFESKRLVVSVLNHLAILFTSVLSTCLFTLVLFHELVLSLRKNIYLLLHLDDELLNVKLPSSAKYSELHSLFWSSDTSQKIRISDDFQSFEVLSDQHSTLLDYKLRSRTDSAHVNEEQGIILSFVSSPGISRVQQFNNKYKEKLKKRPHWWKVSGYTPTAQEFSEAGSLIERNSLAGDESYSSKDVKTSDFKSSKFILASSPQADLNTADGNDMKQKDCTSPSMHFHSPSISSSKIHSKLKLAIESNRHNVINQYAKNLKTFKIHHHPLVSPTSPTHDK